MKRWRGALVLALAGALALVRGGEAGTGTWPSGLTTYTFQDGVYPTSAYTGCADTYVHNDSGAVTLKIRNYGAAPTLNTTSSTYTGGEQACMVKFTFLASDGVTGGLPANFVVTYARLGLYKVSRGTDGNAGNPGALDLYCYRTLVTWTEGSGTGVKAGYCNYDSASSTKLWADGGVFDGINENVGVWGIGGPFDAGVANTDSSANIATATFFGADTLYQSVSNPANPDVAHGSYGAIPFNPTDVAKNRVFAAGGTAAKNFGRIYFNVTRDVSLMVIGAIKNNGWTITNSGTTMTHLTMFASAENSNKNKRPTLEVWGYTISSGGTSGRRRAGF